MADFEEAIKNLYKLHSKKQKDTKGTKNKFDSKENFRGKKGFSDSGIPLTAKTQSKQKANKDRYAGRKGSYHFSPLKRINDAAAELGRKYRYKNPEHVRIVTEAVEIAKNKIENEKKATTTKLADDARSKRSYNAPAYVPDTSFKTNKNYDYYDDFGGKGVEDGSVEISQRAIDRITSKEEPQFKNKIAESIWRLKNKK